MYVFVDLSTPKKIAPLIWCFMIQYFRFLSSSIATLLVMFLAQPSVLAQSSGAEGQDLAAPWTMGNIIIVLFAIGLFSLAVKSSRRDTSAIPDAYGKRPNPRDKKKKGKQKPDFSKGPIQHPELERATTLTIVAFFIPFMLLFSLPVTTRVREDVKGDPRFLGEGTAKILVILNFVAVGLWILGIIGGVAVTVLLLVSGGGAG